MSARSFTSQDDNFSHEDVNEEYSDDYDEESSEKPSDTRVLNPFHKSYLKHLTLENISPETKEEEENPEDSEKIKNLEINSPGSIEIESDDDDTLFSFSEAPPTPSEYPQNIVNVDTETNSSIISSSLILTKTNSPISRENRSINDSPDSKKSLMTQTIIFNRINSQVFRENELINQENDSISEINLSENSTLTLDRENSPVYRENDFTNSEHSSMVSTVILERNNPPISRENDIIKQENHSHRSTRSPQSPDIEIIDRIIDFDDRNSTDTDFDSDPNEFEPDTEIDDDENDINLGNLEENESQRRKSRKKRVPKVNKYYLNKRYRPHEDKAMIDILIEEDLIESASRLSTWKRIAEMNLPKLRGRPPASLHSRFRRVLLDQFRYYTDDPCALERFKRLQEYVEEQQWLISSQRYPQHNTLI